MLPARTVTGRNPLSDSPIALPKGSRLSLVGPPDLVANFQATPRTKGRAAQEFENKSMESRCGGLQTQLPEFYNR